MNEYVLKYENGGFVAVDKFDNAWNCGEDISKAKWFAQSEKARSYASVYNNFTWQPHMIMMDTRVYRVIYSTERI